MDLKEIGWEGEGWINPAQDRDKWRTLVNVVINFRVPQMRGIFD
jgi:hypothetical protein